VTFIDDFSRKTRIFFMKAKDEVFSQFREFKDQVENYTGNNIKVLSLDNGREYTSNEFKDCFKKVGIKRELTVSYNPQQNGVAERKNMSIVNSSRDMIHEHEFSMFLWVEECNIVVYV
jgi:transposase InsO family protein